MSRNQLREYWGWQGSNPSPPPTWLGYHVKEPVTLKSQGVRRRAYQDHILTFPLTRKPIYGSRVDHGRPAFWGITLPSCP
uniref:Uncharacterized protein n=1 Tax=Daucus carota subsp. sativus TaxID=79200 RepID=A0A175YEW1_DAUCS